MKPWDLGQLRRLKRYIACGLSYGEAAQLIGCTRNAALGAAYRYGFKLSLEEIKDRKARAGYERKNVKRLPQANAFWEPRLIETWSERKARKARELSLKEN
jgi:hypothetical protein